MLAAVFLALVTMLGPIARAEPPPSGAPRVELIVEANDEPLSARLVTALEAQLGELGVVVVVQMSGSSRASGEQAPIALVWIRSRDGTLVIQFFEPRGERLRVREVPVSGHDPVSIEEVSLIVRSYVEALLVTPPAAVAEARPVAEEKPEAPPQETPGPQPQADVAFILSSLAGEAGWQPGARLGLGVAGLGPFSLGIQGTLLPELALDREQVSLYLRRYPFGVFASARVPVVSRLSLVPRLNAQLEVVHRHAVAQETFVPTADGTRTSLVLGAELQVEWQLLASAGLYVSGGADVVLGRYDYSISTPDGDVTVLSPQPVRPLLGVGLWLRMP